jgi:hypothetical protein
VYLQSKEKEIKSSHSKHSHFRALESGNGGEKSEVKQSILGELHERGGQQVELRGENERPEPSAGTLIPRVFIARGLLRCRLCFFSVMLHVGFCRLSPVLRRMLKVTMGSVGVVGRLVVVPPVIVFRGLAMMPRRVLMVFGCFAMVFCCLFRHNVPQCEIWPGRCVFVRVRAVNSLAEVTAAEMACAGPHENTKSQNGTDTGTCWAGRG